MKISKLNYFLAAAEELNITRAAQKLYITQQSLSENIAQLEEEYHVTLFRRRPSLSLTPAGEKFAALARQMIGLEAHIRAEMADIAQQNAGVLSIGVRRPYSEILIPHVLPQFVREHPHIQVHVFASSTPEMAQQLIDGKIDLCIGIARYMKNRNFENTTLWSDRYCIVIPDSILRECFGMTEDDLQSGREPDFSKLAEVPLILRDSKANSRATSDLFLLHIGVASPNVLAELKDPILPLRYCAQGLGVTFALEKVFNHFTRFDMQGEKLHAVPLPDSALDPSTSLCTYKGRYLSHAAQDFIELVKEAGASGKYF